MASKIFMGDMSELLEKILKNLNNEFYSLYSCTLVNQHWCKVAIPILWQDPFSFEQNPLFISRYFSSLDENEKFVLKKYGIDIKFSISLFNYASFLKVFDLSSIDSKVEKWIDYHHGNSRISVIYPIVNLLFKLFVESGATLHKVDLNFHDYEINPQIFYALARNELFFSQLQDLSLGPISDFTTENASALLRILAKYATKISSLKLYEFYSDYEPELFYALICIIKSQERLKLFHLVGKERFLTEFHGIISALECQNQSLQEVIIDSRVYTAEFKVLMNCKNLEALRIICDEDQELLKMLSTSLYKINTLEIVDCDELSIVSILEKSSSLLQRLKLESNLLGESLLKTLEFFCPNITHLDISCIVFSKLLIKLIGNLQKLQSLTLLCTIDTQTLEEELKIQVMKFAVILPLTLQYLDLRIDWLTSYIDILLNYCNSPLKKLLICGFDNAKALIEFCLRKKTLNYVGLVAYSDLDDDFKKEVEGYVTMVPYKHIIDNFSFLL